MCYIVVDEWDYRCANWIYTVLSKVRTRKGLFLTKPLDLDRKFNVPETESLIEFEHRIRANLEQPTWGIKLFWCIVYHFWIQSWKGCHNSRYKTDTISFNVDAINICWFSSLESFRMICIALSRLSTETETGSRSSSFFCCSLISFVLARRLFRPILVFCWFDQGNNYGDKTGRSRQNDLLRIESLKIAKHKLKIIALHYT